MPPALASQLCRLHRYVVATADLWAQRCPPRCIQLHAPCKLPPTALGSAFCNPVQMRPCPRVKDCLYVPSCSLRTSFLRACLGPVDCVALRDAPRCFCLFVDTSLLVARCTACLHQSSSQKKKMFVTIDVPAMNVAMQSVLSLCFETHDGLREGLWRLHKVPFRGLHCLMPSFVISRFHLTEYPMKNLTGRGLLLVHYRETRDCARCQRKLCDTALDFGTVHKFTTESSD